MNLATRLQARAAQGGWSEDVAFLAGDCEVTHDEVYDGAARAAGLLCAMGVGRGDRVLIALPDGPEFAWSFLGAVRAGAVAVPVNPRLTEADHHHLAADAEARVVVCTADLAPRFEGWSVVTELKGLHGVRARSGPPLPPAPVDGTEPAYAQYTSGTTGMPKGAVHAHADPLTYHEAFARRAIDLRHDDVVLSVSKLYFAYGLGNALFFPLLSGCRAVLHAAHPQPDDIAELVRRHGVTVLFAVPTFYAHLVACIEPGTLPSLRVAVSAGEPLGVALAERARAALGCPILDGIGSTEVGQTFASNTLAEWRDGTVGRALPPYRVRVRDGDLWVAGPTLLSSYVGRDTPPPERDGEWLSTGDRAELDADGWLRLQGRSDDIELVGGISLSPLEIETVLVRHPAVTEVAVAGVVGADGATRLEAFVVCAPGASPSDSVATELVAMARAELAPFKVPKEVQFVEALPRTPTGKLRRFVLRQPPNRSM